ncbi:hypothetical protein GCM10022416_27650 [Actinomadura keratinilytica]|uniref:Uncharacterized protein n=1 Tax=Actinomadura keratinilytica TaxID=547461 RepID=A0ABP7YS76_9ACTN
MTPISAAGAEGEDCETVDMAPTLAIGGIRSGVPPPIVDNRPNDLRDGLGAPNAKGPGRAGPLRW